MTTHSMREGRGDLLVLYFQATLGHAHRARVRRLDAIKGIRCIGVQYADRELTRPAEPDDGTPVETLGRGVYEHIPWPRRAWSALRFAQGMRPSAAIIDCPADLAQLVTGRGLQRIGVPTLVRWASTREDHPRSAVRERLKRPFYAGWDGYVTTGIRAAHYVESFGVPSRRIFTCGNPVDDAMFDALGGTRPESRSSTFLFVGRWIWHKNLDRLLDAFALYRSRGGTFGLEIVGDGSGPYAERLRRRIALAPGVRARGFLGGPDLASAYRTASCLVLPSLSENWGLVVNEAMLAGIPVIVSERCGCVPELVGEGENGFVIDPLDSDALANALMRVEGLGAQGRAQMGARAASRVAEQSAELWAERVGRAVRETCIP